MEITLEQYEKELREIKLDLGAAQIKALDFSNKIDDFDMSKPINILEKQIADIHTGVAWLLNDIEEENKISRFFHFDVPFFVKIGTAIRVALRRSEVEKNE